MSRVHHDGKARRLEQGYKVQMQRMLQHHEDALARQREDFEEQVCAGQMVLKSSRHSKRSAASECWRFERLRKRTICSALNHAGAMPLVTNTSGPCPKRNVITRAERATTAHFE